MKKNLILLIGIMFAYYIPTYAAEIENSYYWTHARRINVYIPQDRRRGVMKNAFAKWKAVSNKKIDFNFVEFPKQGDIIVQFVDKIDYDNGHEGMMTAGLTTTQYQGTKIKQAKIQIASKSRSNAVLSESDIYSVMLHEIGHALGLSKHSDNKNSVMYYCVLSGQRVLNEDIEKLKKIYRIQ